MVDSVLIMVIDCDTSLELWEKLAEMFMSHSKKGSFAVSDYFNKIKKIADSLDISGNPISSTDFIMHLLTSLDDNYESLVISILTRLEKNSITVEEVYSLMLSHEIRMQMNKGQTQNEMLHDMSVNFTKEGFNCNKAHSNN